MSQPPADSDIPARAVAIALAWFWGIFVALNTARALALGFYHQDGALLRRILVALVGAALAWAMYRLLMRVRHLSTRTRFAIVATTSLPAALLFATTNFLVFDVLAPLPGESCAGGRACTLGDAATAISNLWINWSFVFAAWGLLYIAMAAAAQTRAADRRASDDRAAARLAEIRALRYQVNPHFLFNVLNALAALVRRRDTSEAEGLIGDVGQFFRHSLTVDPVADAPLSDEIDMQSRYLAIERRRFPDRLIVEIDIEEQAAGALVPSLILQPLVENVIKHGVARSTEPVRIAIRATITPDGLLHLVVEDDAMPAVSPGAGTAIGQAPSDGLGVGLKNVADRLAARFGPTAGMAAGPRFPRGYRVELHLPRLSH